MSGKGKALCPAPEVNVFHFLCLSTQMEEPQLTIVNKMDRKLNTDLEELNRKCVERFDTLQQGKQRNMLIWKHKRKD